MEFQSFHKSYFNAIKGAYSKVTDREHFDSQITLTDIESKLIIEHFGRDNIVVGNVKSDPHRANKQFSLYPTFETVGLNLVFPKPDKPELRLYIAKSKGFKPIGNEIWFIYVSSENQLVIGSLPEPEWCALGQDDEEDIDYQEEVENTIIKLPKIDIDPSGVIKIVIGKQQLTYYRDPRIAAMRFDIAGFKCEINQSHTTFIAQRTNQQFMEAHHLIPMKYQNLFEMPLDCLDNVVSLCPNCHRAFHHATAPYKYELVESIYAQRPFFKSYQLDEIAQFYNSVKIVEK